MPFLLHDSTLERTTSGKGIAGEQTWDALSQLDAGSWHSRSFAGEPLPTFANIAQFCLKNGYFLNIEIKPTPGQEAETGKIVAEHAARLWKDRMKFPPLLHLLPPRIPRNRPSRRPASAARFAAGHAVERLARNRLGAGLHRHRLQPRPVGQVIRHPSQKRRFSLPELHRQRRMGGQTLARFGHGWHHYRSGGYVFALY